MPRLRGTLTSYDLTETMERPDEEEPADEAEDADEADEERRECGRGMVDLCVCGCVILWVVFLVLAFLRGTGSQKSRICSSPSHKQAVNEMAPGWVGERECVSFIPLRFSSCYSL